MNNLDKKVLPSNGLLKGIPREVMIRGMKGIEISTLFSSLTDAAVDEIIRAVTDPSLNPEDLCDEDKLFILHQTRILTFGDEVEQSLRCPHCGHIHNYTINYSDLEFTTLEQDVLDDKLVLPDKMTITRRIPTSLDMEEINRYKERMNLPKSYSFLLLQASRISKVNNKKKSIAELIELLENMPGDSLMELYRFLDISFGLNTNFEIECHKCGSRFTGGLGINADLFRKPDKTV